MKIRITKRAAKVCEQYTDCCHCLAATAIKRQLGGAKQVFMGETTVIIDGSYYVISPVDARKIQKSYTKSGKAIRRGFKPFTVEMI